MREVVVVVVKGSISIIGEKPTCIVVNGCVCVCVWDGRVG